MNMNMNMDLDSAAAENSAPRVKKILYIQRRAPHGTNYAQEGLEMALVGAAFAQRVCIAFVDDGVFQLQRGQDARAFGAKNFTAAFQALADYEITEVLVERESLVARGLTAKDLVALRDVKMRVVAADALAETIAAQDVLLNF